MARAGNPGFEGTEGGRRVINLKPTWFQVTKFQELQLNIISENKDKKRW